jgi:hypothetical protein
MTLSTWIEETKAICEKATPNWNYEAERYSAKCVIGNRPDDDRWIASFQPEFNGEDNAQFAVYARTALPKALKIIEELQKRLDWITSADTSDEAQNLAYNALTAAESLAAMDGE